MHRLATIEDLHLQNHALGLYCITCDRWADADLGRLIGAGLGHRVITRTKFSCTECGDPAEKQVRPPVPQVGGAVAYMEFGV